MRCPPRNSAEYHLCVLNLHECFHFKAVALQYFTCIADFRGFQFRQRFPNQLRCQSAVHAVCYVLPADPGSLTSVLRDCCSPCAFPFASVAPPHHFCPSSLWVSAPGTVPPSGVLSSENLNTLLFLFCSPTFISEYSNLQKCASEALHRDSPMATILPRLLPLSLMHTGTHTHAHTHVHTHTLSCGQQHPRSSHTAASRGSVTKSVPARARRSDHSLQFSAARAPRLLRSPPPGAPGTTIKAAQASCVLAPSSDCALRSWHVPPSPRPGLRGPALRVSSQDVWGSPASGS